MARPKQVLFLGRNDKDTSYDFCVDECRKRGWVLISATGQIADPSCLIKKSDYVFATGYLSILESFKLGKIVLCHYNNSVKKDYLLLHPMSKYFVFNFDDIPAKLAKEPQRWAKEQTWDKLADIYETLWQK